MRCPDARQNRDNFSPEYTKDHGFVLIHTENGGCHGYLVECDAARSFQPPCDRHTDVLCSYMCMLNISKWKHNAAAQTHSFVRIERRFESVSKNERAQKWDARQIESGRRSPAKNRSTKMGEKMRGARTAAGELRKLVAVVIQNRRLDVARRLDL